MQHSEQIEALASALAIVQGEIEPAIKENANPQFKGTKYADLKAIRAVVQSPLAKNGLSVPQFIESEGEFVIVTTMLLHKSGQWMRSSLSLRPTKQDPQGYGSAATYGKRYGLAAVLGVVADDDDDGNGATFDGTVIQNNDHGSHYSAPRPSNGQQSPIMLKWLSEAKDLTEFDKKCDYYATNDKYKEQYNTVLKNFKSQLDAIRAGLLPTGSKPQSYAQAKGTGVIE